MARPRPILVTWDRRGATRSSSGAARQPFARLKLEKLESRVTPSTVDFGTLADRLTSNLNATQSSLNSAFAAASTIPIIGKNLQQNNVIRHALDQFDTLANQLRNLGAQTSNAALGDVVRNNLYPLVNPYTGTLPGARLADLNGDGVNPNDIVVTPDVGADHSLTVKMLLHGDLVHDSSSIAFDLGLPKLLNFQTTGSVDFAVGVDYALQFTFDPTLGSLSLDPTSLHDLTPALPATPFALTVNAGLPGFTATGRLSGLLRAQAADEGSHFGGAFGVGISSANSATVTFTAATQVRLGLSLDFGDGNLPFNLGLAADFKLDWGFNSSALTGSATQFGTLSNIGFDNVALKLGDFLPKFLQPVITYVQKFTQPLQPVVDAAKAEIPGLDKIGVHASLRTLMDVSQSSQGYGLALDAIDAINHLTGPGGSGIQLPLGNFTLGSDLRQQLASGLANTLTSFVPPGILAAADQASGGYFTQVATANTYGLQFPILTDTEHQVFGLMLGHDASLFTYTMPPFQGHVGANFSAGIPYIASIDANAEATFTVDFRAGYDTNGLRRLVGDVGQGVTDAGTLAADVFSGFYVDNTPFTHTDAQGQVYTSHATDLDIHGTLELRANALIAHVSGGLYANVNFHLDPSLEDANHLIRLDRLVGTIAAGHSPFSTSGKVYFSADFTAGISTPLFSITIFRLNIAYAELVSFDPPSDTHYGTPDGTTIVLHKRDMAVGPVTTPRDETIRAHSYSIPLNGSSDDYETGIEVDYFDGHELFPVVRHIGGIDTQVGQYTLFATDGATAGNKTIVIDDVDGDLNHTPVDAVLIGGAGDDVLEYHGRGHAVIIGAEGNNKLRADGTHGGSGAIEYGNTIDPTGPALPTLPFSVPAWVTANIDGQRRAVTAGNNVIVGSGAGDFVVAGNGDDYIQGVGGDGVYYPGRGYNTIALKNGPGYATGTAFTYASTVYADPAGVNSAVIEAEPTSTTTDVTTVTGGADSGGPYVRIHSGHTDSFVYNLNYLAVKLHGSSVDFGDVKASHLSGAVAIASDPGASPYANTVSFDSPYAAPLANYDMGFRYPNAAGIPGITGLEAIDLTDQPNNFAFEAIGFKPADVINVNLHGGNLNIDSHDYVGATPQIVVDARARTSAPLSPAPAVSASLTLSHYIALTDDGHGGSLLGNGQGGDVDLLGTSLPQDSLALTLYAPAFVSGGPPQRQNVASLDLTNLGGTLLFNATGYSQTYATVKPSRHGLNASFTHDVSYAEIYLTVDDSAAAGGGLFTLGAQSLAYAADGGPSGTTAFSALGGQALPSGALTVVGNAADRFMVENVPSYADGGLTNAPPNSVVIRSTTATRAPVYVMGTSGNLYLRGNLSLTVGRRLHSDGTVDAVGDLGGFGGHFLGSVFFNPFGGVGNAPLLIDRSHEANNVTGATFDDAATSFYGAGYAGYVSQLFHNGGDVYYKSNVDVTLLSNSLVSQFFTNTYTVTYTPAAFRVQLSGTQPDRVLVQDPQGRTTVDGNGSSVVILQTSSANNYNLLNVPAEFFVNSVGTFQVNASDTRTFNRQPVTLSGNTITGIAGNLIHFSGVQNVLEADTAWTMPSNHDPLSVTVNDTPPVAVTKLAMGGGSATVLGTTGALQIYPNAQSGVTHFNTVAIGTGTLTNVRGQVLVEDVTTTASVDGHADAVGTVVANSLAAVNRSFTAFTGLAPAVIGLENTITAANLTTGAGGTYSILNSQVVGLRVVVGPNSGVTIPGSAGGGGIVHNLEVVGPRRVTVKFPAGLVGDKFSAAPDRPTDPMDLTIDQSAYNFYETVTVNRGSGGYDAVTFAQAGPVIDDFQFPAAVARLTVLGNPSSSYNSSFQQIVVNDTPAGGAFIDPGVNNVTVAGTTGPLTVNRGTLMTRLTLGANGSTQAIQGAIDILEPTPGRPTIDLVADDSADAVGRSIDLKPGAAGVTAVSGLAPAPIRYAASAFFLKLTAGVGPDHFDVTNTAASGPVNLNGGGGADDFTIYVGPAGAPGLTIDGGAGADLLAVRAADGQTAVTKVPGAAGAGTVRVAYPTPVILAYANLETVRARADLNASISYGLTGSTYNRRTQTTFQNLTVTNTGPADLTGDLVVTLTGLPLGTARLASVSVNGVTVAVEYSAAGIPTFKLTGGLVRGQSVQVTIGIFNPNLLTTPLGLDFASEQDI